MMALTPSFRHASASTRESNAVLLHNCVVPLSCDLEHANHQGGFDAQVSGRKYPPDKARRRNDMGPSLLHNASGWETSRTHDHHWSCERYRSEEIRRVPGGRSSEGARNHQPIATLPGKAEDIWSALQALHRERAEDRSGEFGPPQ